MRIEGEYLFNGPKDEVWKIMQDPEVLATALPGTKSLDKIGENEYKGEMNIRVGPVSGIFTGQILISNEVPPTSLTMTIDGRGSPGFLNGSGNVVLNDQGNNTTLMKYDGDVNIGGKLASVGQRLLDSASKSMIRQGLEALDLALQARVTAKSEGKAVEYSPPSESKFAAAVAKDMAKDMLSSRTVWIIVAVIVIVIVIALFWISKSHGG